MEHTACDNRSCTAWIPSSSGYPLDFYGRPVASFPLTCKWAGIETFVSTRSMPYRQAYSMAWTLYAYCECTLSPWESCSDYIPHQRCMHTQVFTGTIIISSVPVPTRACMPCNNPSLVAASTTPMVLFTRIGLDLEGRLMFFRHSFPPRSRFVVSQEPAWMSESQCG